jgi:hypothetical protein
MVVAVVDFRRGELQPAVRTSKGVQPSPDLPENITPRHIFLPQENYELVDFKAAVWDVFGDDITVEVDKDFGFFACHPFSLGRCEQGRAVNASIEEVEIVLDNKIKLPTIQLTSQLILSIPYILQLLRRHQIRQLIQ